MARQDIHADTVYGDLTVADNTAGKVRYAFSFLDEMEGEDNDNFCYGEASVPPEFGTKWRNNKGIFVYIPYLPVFKCLKLRFSVEAGNGDRQYLLNKTDNRTWFPVCRVDGDGGPIPVHLSEFYGMNDSGAFCLVPQEGFLALFSGEETDLEIKAALPQNEVFLLKAMAGNLYQHPATGVGLIEFLHGNFENSSLAAKLQREFEGDGMIINNAYMDSATGELFLDVKEKNG
jgi:hypothetical protein